MSNFNANPPKSSQFGNRSQPDKEAREKGNEKRKQNKSINQYLKEIEHMPIGKLQKLLDGNGNGNSKNDTVGHFVAMQIWKKIIDGDNKSLQLYLDRIYGRPKLILHTVAETEEVENPPEFVVRFVDGEEIKNK